MQADKEFWENDENRSCPLCARRGSNYNKKEKVGIVSENGSETVGAAGEAHDQPGISPQTRAGIRRGGRETVKLRETLKEGGSVADGPWLSSGKTRSIQEETRI